MKIAEQVRRSLPGIIAYCEVRDQAEFGRLCDARWSKETFDINYPFWQRVEAILPDQSRRYWRQVWQVNGVAVRVSSQWFNPPTSRSQPMLARYLAARGIMGVDPGGVEMAVPSAARTSRGRYRSPAIGNAQNGLIRNILARIGDESFGEAEWLAVIADFDHRCAYCGAQGTLDMDHVIPINRGAMGEHRLGNLVPSCRACNTAKASRDFREFLADAPDRLAAIQAYIARFGYRPIGENPQLQRIFELAHGELRQLADRYAQLVAAVLTDEAVQSEPCEAERAFD